MQISQETISTVEAPETHSRQLKNSQFHTVKTLYPVGSGVFRMWRQREKKRPENFQGHTSSVHYHTMPSTYTRQIPHTVQSAPFCSFPLPLLLAFTHGNITNLRASCTSLPTSYQSSRGQTTDFKDKFLAECYMQSRWPVTWMLEEESLPLEPNGQWFFKDGQAKGNSV